MYWTPRGWCGIPIPRWDFFFWGGGGRPLLKPGFCCVIRFKLSSILAPNVYIYDCSIRGGGGQFLLLSNVLDTKGGGGVGGCIPLPRLGTFWKSGC